MKRVWFFLVLIVLMGLESCAKRSETLVSGKGFLCVELDVNPSVVIYSKADEIDVSTFSLEIAQRETGLVIKTISPIGNSQGPIELASGSYTVKAYSKKFLVPAFDMPVYGGATPALIAVGNETHIGVQCTQTNAGVRISYTDAFKANHTTYTTTVRQTQGALTFTSTDAAAGRIGYFLTDRVTILVTADGQVYEQEIVLEPQKLYNIKVDDAPQPVAGELNFQVTVSTQVIEEDVEVVFPSGVVDYTEMVGSLPVASAVSVNSYTQWSNKKVTYAGQSVTVLAENPSDYIGASGGNYLIFNSAGSSFFTISGLNTASAARDMILSFGSCCLVQNYAIDKLSVSVSADGGTTFTPLSIAEDARPLNKRWARISITEGIPKVKNLFIRFDCSATGYMVDDISLKTL